MNLQISKKQYADLFGPTVNDKLQLGDTNLFVEVEHDYAAYGDELCYGGGKTVRQGMGMSPGATQADGALDHVITNVVVMDPVLGIVKGDVGFRNGKVAGVGKAGNPGVMDNVDENLVVSAATEVSSGEGCILTPGFLDCHIHMICPQQAYEALGNGTTTFIGGGAGPAEGTAGVTATSGPLNMRRMLEASEEIPINWCFSGKANDSKPETLVEQLEAGAGGFKLHEDFGATAAALDNALNVCDEYDVQLAIHTDTLNEGLYVDDSISAINGRTVHTYHTEGAGGGHAPDLMKIAGEPNVLPSSTNPTRPFTVNTIDETFDMIMTTHHLNSQIPEDVAFAESRIRAETIAAEDVFHDLGLLSMIGADSQARGRVGETAARCFQNAHKGKEVRGKLPEDSPDNDNFRVKRYLAKISINTAITCGIADYVGSLEDGKMADAVLWDPQFFATKPKRVYKAGFIAYSAMGDPNASIPTPEPVYWRPMFGSYGAAMTNSSAIFVSKAAMDVNIRDKYGLKTMLKPVKKTRYLGKQQMLYNDRMGDIKIDPETHKVYLDGELITTEPSKELPLTQRYYLF